MQEELRLVLQFASSQLLAIKPAVIATSSRLRRTEDDLIDENNESNEEEKQEKKQEIKMGKKKQTETYDQDS